MLPTPPPETSTTTSLEADQPRAESPSTLLAALRAAEPVTTLATLITALKIDDERAENRLREQLYNLRIEGVIDFDRPLSRFSAIRYGTGSGSHRWLDEGPAPVNATGGLETSAQRQLLAARITFCIQHVTLSADSDSLRNTHHGAPDGHEQHGKYSCPP